MQELTKQWLSEGVKDIYEATFQYDGVLALVDILHKKEDGSFEIYEVKSSTWSDSKKNNSGPTEKASKLYPRRVNSVLRFKWAWL